MLVSCCKQGQAFSVINTFAVVLALGWQCWFCSKKPKSGEVQGLWKKCAYFHRNKPPCNTVKGRPTVAIVRRLTESIQSFLRHLGLCRFNRSPCWCKQNVFMLIWPFEDNWRTSVVMPVDDRTWRLSASLACLPRIMQVCVINNSERVSITKKWSAWNPGRLGQPRQICLISKVWPMVVCSPFAWQPWQSFTVFSGYCHEMSSVCRL